MKISVTVPYTSAFGDAEISSTSSFLTRSRTASDRVAYPRFSINRSNSSRRSSAIRYPYSRQFSHSLPVYRALNPNPEVMRNII
jgi:hypothetical protein